MDDYEKIMRFQLKQNLVQQLKAETWLKNEEKIKIKRK